MNQERLAAVDALRGLAILMVVGSHLGHGGVGASSWWNWGGYGVTLFLVLSGFCIHQRWARQGGPSPALGTFWKKRFFRLYPAYAVAVLGTLALCAGSGRLSTTWVMDLVVLALMLQNFCDVPDRWGNGPLWSLALEEQLYWLYFPLLKMRQRLGWRATLVVVMMVQLGWRLLWWLQPQAASPRYTVGWPALGPSRWLAWVLGAVAVEAWLGRVTLPAWARSPRSLLGCLLVALAMTPPSGEWWVPSWFYLFREGVWGMTFFVMLNWALGWEGLLRGSWLAGLGRMSYSLYLVHYPLLLLTPHETPLRRLALAWLGGLLIFVLVENRRFGARLTKD